MPLKGRNLRSWIVKFFIEEYVLNLYFNSVFCSVYVDLLESSLSLYHAGGKDSLGNCMLPLLVSTTLVV